VAVGCVAGDAESYILFCDFFDRVIEAYHEQKITSQTPESDLNYDNLKWKLADISSAQPCIISTKLKKRLPSHCGYRRRKERDFGNDGILPISCFSALQQLEQELAGRLLLLTDLSQEQQSELSLKAPTSFQLRIGVARDWPDARAVWVSENRSLLVWVNIDEHLRLVSMREDANVAEAFQCICISLQKLEKYYRGLRHPFIWKQQLGWVTSSPANVGTGLRISVLIKLQHLPTHKHLKDVLKRLRINMDKTGMTWVNSPELYNISNMATFGFTEVALTQLVVDGVKLLTIMEKRLEGNLSIDELVPAQK
uniref:creatine kinase n=1 Tax=Pundamilia nyererei TaxID=303518 RepID=A0A3B4GKC1_9CICH